VSGWTAWNATWSVITIITTIFYFTPIFMTIIAAHYDKLNYVSPGQ